MDLFISSMLNNNNNNNNNNTWSWSAKPLDGSDVVMVVVAIQKIVVELR